MSPDPQDAPLGALVLVVGPSGAGKDSVLAAARARLPADAPIRFQRRVITRPAEAGGEDHEPIDEAGFAERVECGGFALHWAAHGLRYGLPAALEGDLAAGWTVVANASRGILGQARAKYPRLSVLHITAPDAVLAARLAARGRETADQIEARLARAGYAAPRGPRVVEIVNHGALEDAARRVADLLLDLSRTAGPAG
ncbi:MAG: phosphonate metabolism protein/1,5-bisphosphokinase (PRPP-forming) PhnN [Marivibrio sp.]|uniref:phosphonate metabolism protein/1,5-bisphosphokinase (PRPP-forming) PhnN n=1 Tax=Marivibrio sp. TaxID=2039719 RepID=UPI0032EEEB64